LKIKGWTFYTKQSKYQHFYLYAHKEQLKNSAPVQMEFFCTQIIKKTRRVRAYPKCAISAHAIKTRALSMAAQDSERRSQIISAQK
jgi:hypothetical protein